MADPELGTKQVCPNCEAKFYDLNKRPAKCPKCDHTFDPADETVQATKTKVRAAAAKEAVPEDEDEELEEEEAAKAAAAASDEDEEESSEDQAKEPQALPEPFPSQCAVNQFLLDDGCFFVQQSVLNPRSIRGG